MFDNQGLSFEEAEAIASNMMPATANDAWWEGFDDYRKHKSVLQTSTLLAVCCYHHGWMYAKAKDHPDANRT